MGLHKDHWPRWWLLRFPSTVSKINDEARYIYDHLDAFRLIICKSQGTKYESFLHDLAVLEEEMTLSFMDMLKKQGVKLNDFSERELHLLTTTNVNAVFQTVEHDFSREEAIHYADTLDRFFSKAWREFFGY